VYTADITITTKDGNPTSSNGKWTRNGSAAALVFGCPDPTNPLQNSLLVNLFFSPTEGIGVKLFSFPYNMIKIVPINNLVQMQKYRLSLEYRNGILTGFLQVSPPIKQTLFSVEIDIPAGFVGLNVWQGSAFFNNVFLYLEN